MNTPAQNIPPELVDRMLAIIQGVANSPMFRGSGWGKITSELYDQAVALLKLVPTDPDLLEARELAAIDNPVHSALYFSGELDADCAQFLTGIKRGRELAGAKTNG